MDIRRLAQSLVERSGTRDSIRIATDLGYIIVYAPLNGIRGFYQYLKRCHIIYLDEKLNRPDQQWVCAHELGHSLLHQGYNRIFMDTHTLLVTSRFEQEADYFASELLFDDMELECFLEVSLPTAARTLGMSPLITARRLSSIRHLP